MNRLLRAPVVVCLFICPLLFFTNLTRNPYVTQISLINIALAAGAAILLVGSVWREGTMRLPRTAIDVPMAAWIGACALSLLVCCFGHVPFYRPAIKAEGLRNILFVLVNAAAAFYLAVACSQETDGDDMDQTGSWAVFTLVWGCLWLAFPELHTRPGPAADIWSQVFDGYGAVLWALGFGGAFWLCRRARTTDFIHLALSVGFLASVYGVFQYFNVELVWPNVLNPYGGRSVSTFGNPNFISSYTVILLPFAAAFFLESRTNAQRIIYGAVALSLEAELLCSLTRSSWLGAFAALACLFVLWPEGRARARENPKVNGLLVGLALAMVVFWPPSAVSGPYTPSVLSRVTEIKTFSEREGFYSPFHQRVLIWTCAWLMGAENPLTGKGWGVFELFYPFYQGRILNTYDFFLHMRTHANNAHNEIMETWAQTGLMGVGVLFWLWILFFTAAKRHWAETRVRGRMLGLAAAAGALGMLVDNLLNVSIHFAVPGFMFWWAVGVAMSRPAQDLESWRRLPGGRAASRAAAAAALAVLCGIGWYWVRVWNREAHYFAGFKFLRQNQTGAALRELELSRAWGPREVNAIYELGNAYARAERYPDAIAAYRQALDANAGYDEIYFNIGTVLGSKFGRRDEAIRYLNTAWAINPLSNELYMNLGAFYLQDPQRYRDEAIALFERATHFFPENPNHWNNLGYLYSLRNDLGAAENAYAKALVANSDLAVARVNLENALRKSGHPRPPILAGLDELRKLQDTIGKADYSAKTLALAARVAALLPELPKAHFFYGSLLLANGRAPEAVPELEWVVAREPRNVTAWGNLGGAYGTIGRNADAVRAFSEILSIDPQNAAARARLQALGAAK